VAKRGDSPLGTPCWVELLTSDPERSQDFYGRLFGWTVEEGGAEYGGYKNFLLHDVRVAGCMKNDGNAGVPDLWSIYLATEDAEATVGRAAAAGGQVVVPSMDVMTLGRMAVVVDVGGAVIGAWQPGDHRGFGYVAEPGAPAWFELHTRDYEESLAFYREVFGWQTRTESDVPEFRFSTVSVDDEQYAGVMDASEFLPEGVPAGWTVYFGVTDCDHGVSEVVSLGGEVVMAPEDSPYGRLATVADPTGAVFRLHQPPADPAS
jgi:predicted enzyme related to lactoylglutathione lyase